MERKDGGNVYSLEHLQSIGAINGSLKVVDGSTGVTYSEAIGLSEAQQASFNGTIVMDSSKWVATVSAMPIEKAAFVYSSDGEYVGTFNRKKRTFYIMQLRENTLVTIKTFYLKEGQQMAELNMDGLDMENLETAMAESGITKEIDAFKDVKDADVKQPKAKSPEQQQKETLYESVRARMDAISGDNISAPDEVIRNNFMHGRLFGFVAATDPVVKLSLRKVPEKDANGKRIPIAGAPDDIVKDAAAGKSIPLAWCESKHRFDFSQKKPGAVKAVIIGTPAGTDLALTSIGSSYAPQYDMANQDLQIKVLSTDTAIAYVSYNYGGHVREASDVLGERASEIRFTKIIAASKDDPTKPVYRSKITADGRKNLLIDGNFIPMKVYRTIGTQDPSAEEKKILDLNVAAIIERVNSGSNQVIAEDEKSFYSYDAATGEYTSKWFDQGAPIEVASYEDKNVTLKSVRMPSRVKTPTKKDPNKYSYKFEYYGLDDAEFGPLANPTYAQILKAAKLSADVFAKSVEAAVHKTRTTGSKKANNVLSAEQLLRGYAGHDATLADKSLADIQAEIDNLAMLG